MLSKKEVVYCTLPGKNRLCVVFELCTLCSKYVTFLQAAFKDHTVADSQTVLGTEPVQSPLLAAR